MCKRLNYSILVYDKNKHNATPYLPTGIRCVSLQHTHFHQYPLGDLDAAGHEIFIGYLPVFHQPGGEKVNVVVPFHITRPPADVLAVPAAPAGLRPDGVRIGLFGGHHPFQNVQVALGERQLTFVHLDQEFHLVARGDGQRAEIPEICFLRHLPVPVGFEGEMEGGFACHWGVYINGLTSTLPSMSALDILFAILDFISIIA